MEARSTLSSDEFDPTALQTGNTHRDAGDLFKAFESYYHLAANPQAQAQTMALLDKINSGKYQAAQLTDITSENLLKWIKGLDRSDQFKYLRLCLDVHPHLQDAAATNKIDLRKLIRKPEYEWNLRSTLSRFLTKNPLTTARKYYDDLRVEFAPYEISPENQAQERGWLRNQLEMMRKQATHPNLASEAQR